MIQNKEYSGTRVVDRRRNDDRGHDSIVYNLSPRNLLVYSRHTVPSSAGVVVVLAKRIEMSISLRCVYTQKDLETRRQAADEIKIEFA